MLSDCSPFAMRWLLATALLLGACGPRPEPPSPDATDSLARASLSLSYGTAELRKDDRISLIGGALAERMQHHGWLETRLQRRVPELGLSFRNLGFSADELTIGQRTAGFGSRDEWLERCETDVVFAFFGFNESFAGRNGVLAFQADLSETIEHLRALRSPDNEPLRLVLFSPTPCEDLSNPSLPDASVQNERIALYVEAMAEVARARNAVFVDLFTPMLAHFEQARRDARGMRRPWGGIGDDDALTINGIHLTDRGNAVLAEVIESALLGEDAFPDGHVASLEDIRKRVLEKNRHWFDRYRATDGYNVYGGRSSLSYTDGVTNRDVLQQEMEQLENLTHHGDSRIRLTARGLSDSFSTTGRGRRSQAQVKTNKPGDAPDGGHLFVRPSMGVNFQTPAEGMAVNLFAGEESFPELANPVQMSWDSRGRLWVAVWPTYPHRLPSPGRTAQQGDKLLIFEDTDGDGQADEMTVFADGLHNPTGFEFWNGGVFVAAAPDLLFLKDTDGDGVADVRERVLHGLSSADTHHSANSFVMGPDGALYFQEGIFHQSQVETIHGPVRNRDGCVWRFEPRTWTVERYVPYGFLNPHGHVFDRWGQDFVTDGTGNTNYYALPFSGHVEQGRKHGGYFRFFEQSSRPAAATEILSSGHFPDSMQGNYLIANVIGFQGLFNYRITDAGSGFGATQQDPIVHSTETNFRPVDIEVGPDGAIYFLDWQNPLIGHMQHHLRDPSRDQKHGRVYRVSMPERALSDPPDIADRPINELLDLLKHGEDRVRYRTRIELSRHDARLVMLALLGWLGRLDEDDPNHEHHLLEALWTLQQHGVMHEELLDRVLSSPDPRARAAAVRVLRQMRNAVSQPLSLMATAIADANPRVRLEALVGLSFFSSVEAAEIALAALQAPTDRFLDYALKETMATLEPHWSSALATGRAFAEGNPAGQAWALSRLDTDALLGALPSEALYDELLSRHGLDTSQYFQAIAGLADLRGSSQSGELISAIRSADERTDGHADHLLSGLFATLNQLADAQLSSLAGPLRTLAGEGRRASTRKLATAARIRADGSVEPAWVEAQQSLDTLADLLEAVPLLRGSGLEGELFGRALSLMDRMPAELQDEASAAVGTRGRYVRIELLGPTRTLTLAEVQVQSNGGNVAPSGTATQSSTNWGGLPERAMDGNTSGAYGDGGQTHTVEDQVNPWWELDLGREHPIDSIVVWNRTEGDGRWVSRLDGFSVIVLDADRRTTFETRDQLAPPVSAVFNLTNPVLRVRRAAVLAVAAQGAAGQDASIGLAGRLGDPNLRPAVLQGLAGIPLADWSDHAVRIVTLTLVRLFENEPPEDFETAAGRRLLALADRMIAYSQEQDVRGLSEEDRSKLASLRPGLGPQVIVIRPVRDSLTFDLAEFTVQAGRPVELLFDNTDIMPHNLVVTVPGALATVGLAGEAMSKEQDAWARAFVPDLPEVLWATGLLPPGASQTLRFDAPDEPADHPYVCTFPGHWIRMNGVMHVVVDVEAALAAEAGEPDAPHAGGADAIPQPARSFVRNWTTKDFIGRLSGVKDRSVGEGRGVFEAASCLTCHVAEGSGGRTGPPLAESVSNYDREQLLAQILQPSDDILDGYGAEVFVLRNGQVHSGRVMTEDDDEVVVQTNPYLDDVVTAFSKPDIEDRWTSQVSAMPEGLLTTFSREEILSLLAYLESLRATD